LITVKVAGVPASATVVPWSTSGSRKCMCTTVPGAVVAELTLSSITKKIGEPYGKTERGDAGVAETVGTGRGKPTGAAGGGKARAAGVTAHASAAVATAAETIARVRFMSPSAVGGFRLSRG
jgi:hypothetical protein